MMGGKYFMWRRKNGDGNGGKYLDKENIFWRRKRGRKYLEKENTSWGEKKSREGKGRKIS